jgi:hypothetical protein
VNEKTPPRVSENQLISPKPYSDESKEPKPGMIERKSGDHCGKRNISMATEPKIHLAPARTKASLTQPELLNVAIEQCGNLS